jgi:aminodeoxyfutalosine synthase
MAGAETEQALGSKTLVKLIHEAGRIAIERDTLYKTIQIHE